MTEIAGRTTPHPQSLSPLRGEGSGTKAPATFHRTRAAHDDYARLVPAGARSYPARVMANRRTFWQRHPGLVWSNPEAEDSAFICAALLRPRFTRLLDIAAEFGVEWLRHEWSLLREEATPEAKRAAPSVERILSHIEKGFALAAAKN